jgi:alkanesulfonate monooxygenase SsuD/methylene tetrahydromethanopterin reductase-like flavin-dependent oxidoreductase (luciferase family)
MAARFAGEWNGVYLPAEDYAKRNRLLDELAEQAGRSPTAIKRSIMVGCEYGREEVEVNALVAERSRGKYTRQQYHEEFGMMIGTASQIVEQLGRLAEAGAQRVMLQWLAQDDLDRLAHFAEHVLPQVS